MAEAQSFKIVLTRVPEGTQRLLARGGFRSGPGRPIQAFDDPDRALEWCEKGLLDEVALGVVVKCFGCWSKYAGNRLPIQRPDC